MASRRLGMCPCYPDYVSNTTDGAYGDYVYMAFGKCDLHPWRYEKPYPWEKPEDWDEKND